MGVLFESLLRWLLVFVLGLFGVGCSMRVDNTSLKLDSIPKSVASLHIAAPEFLIEGHVDPVKGAVLIVEGVVGLLGPPVPD